jgi:hypothetical protein
MLSECARATTAEAARFRVEYPNFRPRLVKVIALDGASERVVQKLARSPWNRATFFTSLSFAGGPERKGMSSWLSDVAGRTKDLIDEIDSADLIVMVSTAGASAEAASVIGEACNLKRVMTTALVLAGAGTSDEALSRTVNHLRPFASMLVIANAEEYIEDMLTALRA